MAIINKHNFELSIIFDLFLLKKHKFRYYKPKKYVLFTYFLLFSLCLFPKSDKNAHRKETWNYKIL